jgi:hypothetical protein
MKKNIAFLMSFSLFIMISSGCSRTDNGILVIYPAPETLDNVELLEESDDYVVEIRKSGSRRYLPNFVYKTPNTWENTFFGGGGPVRPQEAAQFSYFSFEGTEVEVRITCNFPVNTVTIRPLNHEIDFIQEGNIITFKLRSHKKISIEVNDRNNPLFIFADKPSEPDLNATYYYGPGFHHIGRNKVINSGERVYIEGGAIVEGSFLLAPGSQDIKITGRGILTMGKWPHTSTSVPFLRDNCAIRATTISDFYLEGLIIANSTGWMVSVDNYNYTARNNQYRNLKLISFNGNSDGIWLDGVDHIVDDCFIFNNDDVITTHGSKNCRVTNIVAWGGIWGRFFMHADWHSTDGLYFENINIIGSDPAPHVFLVQGESGRPQQVNNVVFRNVRVEEHPRTSNYGANRFLVIGGRPHLYNIHVNNWLFENITLDHQNIDEGGFFGQPTGLIDGIMFRNLRMAGKHITSLEEANMSKNEFATNIVFE